MSVQVKGSGTIGGLDEGLVVSGIVTSSTQINVGSNIKIGNAGVVTATTFSGSGASLTNLPAGNLTGALPAISGANLTGLTVPGGATNLDLLDSSGTGNGRIRLGASQDLQIYHDGSHSWFKNTTGRLLLQTDGDQIQLRGNTIVAFNGAASTEYLRITSGRKVGIGTNNPTFFTHIQADGITGDVLKMTATASGQMMNIQNKAGSSYPAIVRFASHDGSGFWDLQYNNNDNSFSFDKNDSEKLRITSDGKVGINNTAPEGVGIDIKSSRTTQYSDTGDQRGLAHLILRNSSDAPDRFCSLSFVNGGGTQAEASINLVQTGNYTGDLRFKFRDGSGSSDWRERFRITSSGQVKMAHQPSFYATANSGGTVSMTSTHTLTNWRLSTSGKTYSIGGHFNTSNGRFTAPVAGTYLFTGSILLQGYDQASGIHMIWRKNGSNFQYWYNTRTSDIDRSGYGGYLAQGSTTTMSLDANDYIEVACNFGGSLSLWCGDANWGHFSGHLLG